MTPTPDEIAAFSATLRSVHAHRDERFSFAVLRDREVHMVDFVEAMTWAYENGGISKQLASDTVDGNLVSTAFVSMLCQESRHLNEQRPFETYVQTEFSGFVARKYLTFEEAKEGHVDVLAELHHGRSLR